MDITLRSELLPDDYDRILQLHCDLYSEEQGFDATFAAHVAGPLAEFVKKPGKRDRLWIAERGSELVGCIAIVAVSETEAQLRWFLVAPACRGIGLGRQLLTEALQHCRDHAFSSVILWTVNLLTQASKLYRKAGFEIVERHPIRMWGRELVEEKYSLTL